MQQSDHTESAAGITPIDPALLQSPIDYLHAVHLREREVCTVLERIAERGQASTAEIEAATAFLSNELPAHLEDEDP